MKTIIKYLLAAAAASAAVLAPAGAQDIDFDKIEITSEKLTDNIYMLQGAGGNMGLSAGQDGTFLIDDQFAPLTDKIVEAIAAITARPVDYVFNTHWHFDHAGGNENLGKAGVAIVAHENVRKRLMEGIKSVALNREIAPAPREALPVITFPDEITFHLNGEEMHIFHLEHAHTDGDAVMHFVTSNVVHTGDLFTSGRYPFVDFDSGGNMDGLIAAANSLLDLVNEDTKIIPGHGPLASKADLLKFRDMLVEVRGRIQRLIDDGKSVDEAIAAKPLADMDAEFVPADAFLTGDNFTRVVYLSLTAGKE